MTTPGRAHAEPRSAALPAAPGERPERTVEREALRRLSRDNRRAMDGLRVILASRETLHARADLFIDTAGPAPEASLEALLGGLPRETTA
ncbi:hypothetical protein [Belnapia sp. F-4-1]|uniref:hypothetical protein n=1 Tax=Belnapia sp. F-4-1 TaxID=1545443 RepID=UPI0005BAC0AA|nr:hypothetical protein [Belnapia sp. F-4-1]